MLVLEYIEHFLAPESKVALNVLAMSLSFYPSVHLQVQQRIPYVGQRGFLEKCQFYPYTKLENLVPDIDKAIIDLLGKYPGSDFKIMAARLKNESEQLLYLVRKYMSYYKY